MIEHLTRIATGTLQHIKGIDNIVDLGIFIIASGACIYAGAVISSAIICIISSAYEEIIK